MKNWKLKEKNDAKITGGQRIQGSGNRWYNPGDVSFGNWLLECKETGKKSYSLNIKKWKKISNEALLKYRLPAMSIKIQDTELVILDKDDFLELIKIKNK